MMTPNGRFAPNAKLCMSMTDFHPESWNPLWSVGTILTGLLSFMHDEAQATTGAIVTSSEEKRRLAAGSMASNVKAAAFRKVFPDLVEAFEKGEMDQAKEEEEREKAAAAAAAEPKAAAAAAAAAGPAAAAAGPAARAAGGRGGGGGAGPPPAAPVAPARGGGEFMLLALAVGALAAVAALPLVNSAGGALRWFGL
jgi:ubiquitin-conjugating enzyme E2 J2